MHYDILRMSDKGVLYVADTRRYLNEAKISASQLKKINPSLSVAIATPFSTSFNWNHTINTEEFPRGFEHKILGIMHSPYTKTLFLDTDTYVLSDITGLFDLLDKFEMGFSVNHNRSAMDIKGVPPEFPEYNTGVLLFHNNQKFTDFCIDWREKFINMQKRENIHDQPAFRQTLWQRNVNYVTLPPEWNLMIRYPVHVKNEVKIAHSRLIRFKSLGSNTWVNPSKETYKLNLNDNHRIFVPINGKGIKEIFALPPHGNNIIKKGLFSLRVNGFRYTFARFVQTVVNYIYRS